MMTFSREGTYNCLLEMLRYGEEEDETIIVGVEDAAATMTGCRCTAAVVVLSSTALVLLLRRGR